MKLFLERYWTHILGIFIFLALLTLAETGILELGNTDLESRLIAVFVGLGIALILDSLARNKDLREIIRDELAHNLADTSKLTVLATGTDAYKYLVGHLPKANKVFNTIVSRKAYDGRGMRAPTKEAEAYHNSKLRAIRKGTVAWEDIISPNYFEYLRWLYREHLTDSSVKYSPFVLNSDFPAFDNFIILEYEGGFSEVIFGWIMLYSTATNVDQLYLVQNQAIVKHFKEYFVAMRNNACKRVVLGKHGTQSAK